jgi:hypothetical protein
VPDRKTDVSHSIFSHPSRSARGRIEFPSPRISYFIDSAPRRISPSTSDYSRILCGAGYHPGRLRLRFTIRSTFYKSNVFTDPVRTGFVAMAQIPFVFAFSMKNNFLGMLVGLGYEKVFTSSLSLARHLDQAFIDQLRPPICRKSHHHPWQYPCHRLW